MTTEDQAEKVAAKLDANQRRSVLRVWDTFEDGEDASASDIKVCIDFRLLDRPNRKEKYWEFNDLGQRVANLLRE